MQRVVRIADYGGNLPLMLYDVAVVDTVDDKTLFGSIFPLVSGG
jgi:hypothetical protein